MNKRTILKHRLSISHIGKNRFWIGTITGILTAIILSLLFNYTRESLRLFTQLSADLYMPSENEQQFFNCFYASLSSVLGLSLTIWVWTGNLFQNRTRERLFKRLANSNALFIIWLTLLIIGRFGTILPFILFGSAGYDNNLNFTDDFTIIFYLFPIYIFLQNWVIVQLVYKSFRWMGLSLIVTVILALILYSTTTIDQEKFNLISLKRYEKEYRYIDSTLQASENRYQIKYSPATIEVLKKWYTESSMDQVLAIKNTFTKEQMVSIDTVVLAKVAVHVFKQGHNARWNSIDRWYYPYPKDIYNQIIKYSSNDKETKELLLLLQEESLLINTPELDWEELQFFSHRERNKIFYARHIPFTNTVSNGFRRTRIGFTK